MNTTWAFSIACRRLRMAALAVGCGAKLGAVGYADEGVGPAQGVNPSDNISKIDMLAKQDHLDRADVINGVTVKFDQASTASLGGNLEISFVTFEGFERDDDPDMETYAVRLWEAYVRPDLPFAPVFDCSVQTFSGVVPDTTKLECFDLLLYNRGSAGWISGANATPVFLNSKITAHHVYATLTFSPEVFATFCYFLVRAIELNSPLQFEQARRLGRARVNDSHLSDDFYIEYTRVLSPFTFLFAGASVSYPGAGTRDQRGGHTDVWLGAFANIVWRF